MMFHVKHMRNFYPYEECREQIKARTNVELAVLGTLIEVFVRTDNFNPKTDWIEIELEQKEEVYAT